MIITAQLVKDLRQRTGSGIMECKKALAISGGDIEKAIEEMRKSGQAKVDKKTSRITAEGVIAIATAGTRVVIIEINSETDFVARDISFKKFAHDVAENAANQDLSTLEQLLETQLGSGSTIEDARKELITRVGENVNLRRLGVLEGENIGHYSHNGKIGVIVTAQGGTKEFLKDIAMHIAASSPIVISQNQVPNEIIEKEREIFAAQAAKSGKPDKIIKKMIDGRICKFLNEQSLVGQPFVKNPDYKVSQLLEDNNVTVTGFVRFRVGEGIEKEKISFAKDVMNQVRKKI
jgi:elongation factor Ts